MNFTQQVRRPLVGAALSMVAGFGFPRGLNLSPLLLLALSAGILAWAFRRGEQGSSRTVYLACFMIAAAYGAIEQLPVPRHAILPTAETAYRAQDIAGTVIEDPLISAEDGAVTCLFHVDVVQMGEQWIFADSIVRLRIRHPQRPVAYGERWRIHGWCRGYEPVRSGIGGAFYAAGENAQRIAPAPRSFRGICYQMRQRISPALYLGVENAREQVCLLQALLLGYRSALPYGLYRIFSRTGTFHIFAISGLHVGVMATILIAALKMAGVPKPRWGLFLIPLLFTYVVSTGMKPSAFRAFMMAAVYFSAPLVRRKPDPASAIALSAVVLLLIDPLQLGDPGFLLSFTVVSGIVMVHSFAAHRFGGFRRPGWAVPLAQFNGPRPFRVLMRATGLLAMTSAAAWVFSAPLTARFFNTVSPVALVGNLLIVPLTFAIVLTGCLTLLSSLLFVPAAILFNQANRVFVGALIFMIQRLGELPGAYRFIRTPSLLMLALWYGGLVFLFSGPKGWRRPGLLMVICAGTLWFSTSPRQADGVTVLRGGSACALIQIQDQNLLLAEGSSYSITATARMLREHGINRVQELAFSGPLVEVSAARELCKDFCIPQVCLPPDFEGSPEAGALILDGVTVSYSARPQWAAGDGSVAVEWGF